MIINTIKQQQIKKIKQNLKSKSKTNRRLKIVENNINKENNKCYTK